MNGEPPPTNGGSPLKGDSPLAGMATYCSLVMLTKSDRTRQFIIEKAAHLFNTKGYAATSMSDIIEATGLAKGGIYGNFKSKGEIAVEAFEYAAKKVFDEMTFKIK